MRSISELIFAVLDALDERHELTDEEIQRVYAFAGLIAENGSWEDDLELDILDYMRDM